ASTSPTAIVWPSCATQVEMTASAAPVMTSGMRTSVATSATHPLGHAPQPLDDLLGLRDRRTLEHLGDARRRLAARDALHGLVEPVEEPALDLVGEPAAVGRADRALLDDQHRVGLADRLPDRVPVDARAVEPAQVDHLGVDAGLLDRLERVPDHAQVGEHGQVGARAPDLRLADRDVEVEVVLGDV